jgi:WXXGXW repeat (2 copies)
MSRIRTSLPVISLVLAGLAAASLAGCIVEPARRGGVVTEVVVPRAPPPPRFEEIPPPPRPREVVEWRPGHWHWDGREYVWIPGEYIERPRREAVWEPGHWAERHEGWVWVEGHWR